jgi:hypothetical protein
MSRFGSVNVRGLPPVFFYLVQKIRGGLCGGSAHHRCWGETLYLETRPKVKKPKAAEAEGVGNDQNQTTGAKAKYEAERKAERETQKAI